MVSWILRKVLGSKNQREIKRIRPLVDKINRFEQEFQALTEDQLREKTAGWKKDLTNIDDPDELARRLHAVLPEAFALVKNAARRLCGKTILVCDQQIVWNMIHFDVQLIGGIILHEGKIAEMATGEGKTLVATCPIYLNALTGRGVHLVTVNDYLARRDAEQTTFVPVQVITENGFSQDGTFSRDDFTYDHAGDVYYCPGGKMLTTTSSPVNDGATLRYRASKYDCQACRLKTRCCPKEPARYVPRSIYEGARDMARGIAKSWEGRVSRRLRKKIEMLFAHLKRILKLDRLRLRGPNGARDEFLLAATAQNLRKLAKLIPAPNLKPA